MQKRWILALLAVLMLSALPTQAQVQLQAAAGQGAEGPIPFPLHAWIGLTQSVGSGTFVVNPNNPTVSTSLSLTPFIMYKGWQIMMSQSFGFEWTQSDSTTYANQVELSDTAFLVRNLGSVLKLDDLHLRFWPSVGYVAPLSMASRNAGSLGTFTGAFRANYGGLSDLGFTLFGGVNAGYSVLVPSLGNSFAGNEVKPLQGRLGPIEAVACNVRNAQELNSYACSDGGLPSVGRWGASVGFWWFYLLDGTLGVSANLGYTQSYSIKAGPDDELRAENAVGGIVPRQSTSGDISVTYMPNGWLWLSAGVGSQQPFLTSDGKGVRFPFWDFVSPYSNFSSIYLDATFVL